MRFQKIRKCPICAEGELFDSELEIAYHHPKRGKGLGRKHLVFLECRCGAMIPFRKKKRSKLNVKIQNR